MHINELLRTAVERRASDLHLKAGSYPMMRLDGNLVVASEEKRLEREDTEAIAATIMPRAQFERFKQMSEMDMAYSVPGLGRFRCNVYHQRGHGGARLPRHPDDGAHDRPVGTAAGAQAHRGRGTRARARHRDHRFGQEHHARRDGRPHQPDAVDAHHDGGGPDRVPPPRPPLHRQPAGGRGRHALLRARPAQRAAPGPRRHPRRRDARPRDGGDGAAGRRDRPPGVLHPPHAGRAGEHQPHHRGVPAAPAAAGPHPARQRAAGRGLAAPDAAGHGRRPVRRGRGDDRHAPSSATASSTRTRRT